MTVQEIQLTAKLLDLAADTFSNHGCNDVSEEMYEGWTKEQRQALVKEFHEWNGDPEEYDPEFLHLGDSSLIAFFAAKILQAPDYLKLKAAFEKLLVETFVLAEIRDRWRAEAGYQLENRNDE